MPTILLYGIQRSGTNYLAELLRENFGEIVFPQAQTRNEIIHKHFRLYDDKRFVPEPQYNNEAHFASFAEFDQAVSAHTGLANLPYLVITKNPYSWYLSICKWAKKCKWESFQPSSFNGDYMQDFVLFYEKWCRFAAEAPDRVHLLRYEALLEDREAALNQLMTKMTLQRLHTPYVDLKKVPMSRSFGFGRRKHYSREAFWEKLTAGEIDAITAALPTGLMEELGYEFAGR